MLLTSVAPSRLQSLSWLSSSKQRPDSFTPCLVSAAHPISSCRVGVMSRLCGVRSGGVEWATWSTLAGSSQTGQ